MITLPFLLKFIHVKKIILLISNFLFICCVHGDPEDKIVYVVKPNAETPQVVTKGDAADDPAIWINNKSTTNSLVFGTDKKSGVYTYDLNAKKLVTQN